MSHTMLSTVNGQRGAVQLKSVFLVLLLGFALGLVGSFYVGGLDALKGRLRSFAPAPQVAIKGFPVSFADLAERVSPAVVNISTTKRVKVPDSLRDFGSPMDEFFGKDFWERFFGPQPRERKERSLGSGFIVSKEGYILTNSHVTEGADKIVVRLADGKTHEAEVIGRDAKTDLALLKAKSWSSLPEPLKLGDSDALRVGDWVMAIGNPFGLDHTVTAGIVSAKGRVIGAGPYDDFIQTDASINPGNSGGPLFNIQGEVVGINTAIFSTSGGNIGIGFAVPINMAKAIMSQLEKEGKVTRGWIGVNIQELTPELAESFGVKDLKAGALVADVISGGPAEKAGLEKGDIITEFKGKKVKKVSDLPRLVSTTPIGETVEVKFVRSGEKKTVVVTISEMDEEKIATAGKTVEDLGIKVKSLTPETAERYGYSGAEEGVIVTSVAPDGPAEEAGLKPGDVIKEVNHRAIRTLQDYREAVKSGSLEQGILFFVARRDSSLYVVVKEK